MRSLLALLLLAGTSTARADGTQYTPLVDVNAVTPGCRTLAQTPRNTTLQAPSYDAAISTANCVAMARMRGLALVPTDQFVQMLDDAAAPAIAILDRVIETGDPAYQLIAYYSKVDLLDGMAARLLAALPRLSPTMSRDEVAAHEHLVAATSVLVAPWLRHADVLRRHIAQLVSDHPDLANRDPIVAYMITRTRIADAAGVASR